MKLRLGSFNKVLPFIALVAGAAIILWSFYRSEEYRTQTNIVFSKSYEILYRCSQLREKLANIAALMAASGRDGSSDERLQREMQLLRFNINALRGLPYAADYFSAADLANLDSAKALVTDRIAPALQSRHVDETTMDLLEEVRTVMYDATGTAISNGRGLSESADIEDAARSNFVISMICLALLLMGSSYLLQRASFAGRYSDLLRSFFSLHVHMTRSRLYALSLFTRQLLEGQPANLAMAAAAHRAADELAAINESLLQVAATKRPKEIVALWAVVDQLAETHPGRIARELTDDALKAEVAAPHLFMVLDELVQNSRRALEAAGREASAIVVRGRVVSRWFRKALAIEVVDRGIGMSEEEKEEAVRPFYSSRAGTHVGLGLTGCDEIVRSLGGTLRIFSVEGKGTTVRVLYPLKKAGALAGANL
ncbi:MAG: sensor histidine kinase [Inquilinus sp.]|uniref:sensor histidine kinase n=1 Tax=Inquilinus sp. TaxID=1932117 RepID=UPI003F3856FA